MHKSMTSIDLLFAVKGTWQIWSKIFKMFLSLFLSHLPWFLLQVWAFFRHKSQSSVNVSSSWLPKDFQWRGRYCITFATSHWMSRVFKQSWTSSITCLDVKKKKYSVLNEYLYCWKTYSLSICWIVHLRLCSRFVF